LLEVADDVVRYTPVPPVIEAAASMRRENHAIRSIAAVGPRSTIERTRIP